MDERTVELQVTASRRLSDGEDATDAANGLWDRLSEAVEPPTEVWVNTVTLKRGRRIAQRFHYKRSK